MSRVSRLLVHVFEDYFASLPRWSLREAVARYSCKPYRAGRRSERRTSSRPRPACSPRSNHRDHLRIGRKPSFARPIHRRAPRRTGHRRVGCNHYSCDTAHRRKTAGSRPYKTRWVEPGSRDRRSKRRTGSHCPAEGAGSAGSGCTRASRNRGCNVREVAGYTAHRSCNRKDRYRREDTSRSAGAPSARTDGRPRP